jgi:hypothetical protein
LPLALDFFAENAGSLINDDLARLLDQLIFEPEAFQAEAGLSFDDPDSEALVPVEWEERDKLGTPCGVLSQDLRMRPAVLLAALQRMCVEGVNKCIADAQSSYVSLLLYLVRMATSIEAQMLAVLADLDAEAVAAAAAAEAAAEDEATTSASRAPDDAQRCYDEVMAEALPWLVELRRAFYEPAVALIEHWIVQARRRPEKKTRLTSHLSPLTSHLSPLALLTGEPGLVHAPLRAQRRVGADGRRRAPAI